jgi:hypothetical protein
MHSLGLDNIEKAEGWIRWFIFKPLPRSGYWSFPAFQPSQILRNLWVYPARILSEIIELDKRRFNPIVYSIFNLFEPAALSGAKSNAKRRNSNHNDEAAVHHFATKKNSLMNKKMPQLGCYANYRKNCPARVKSWKGHYHSAPRMIFMFMAQFWAKYSLVQDHSASRVGNNN